jgi:hypothetical protein
VVAEAYSFLQNLSTDVIAPGFSTYWRSLMLSNTQSNQLDTSSNTSQAAQPVMQIAFSVVTAVKPNVVSKQYYKDEKGEIKKESGGKLYEGKIKKKTVANLIEFSAALDAAGPSNAFLFGVSQYPDAVITTRSNLEKRIAAMADGDLPVIARDRPHIGWDGGPGILMGDYDPDPDAPLLPPEQILERFYEAVPELRDAPHLWRPSSSSCIVDEDTGQEIRGIAGQRVYFLVADATDIPRVGKILVDRLWLAGYGRISISKSGAKLERCDVDSSVWQPERFDFCGGALCEKPLIQRFPPSIIYNSDAPPLDTRRLVRDLDKDEKAEVERLKREAKGRDSVVKESKKIQDVWVEERVKASAAKTKEQKAEVRAAFKLAVTHKILSGNFPIMLASGETIYVFQIFADRKKYHNARCPDPVDGGDDKRIAFINTKASQPFIYSHAHGSVRYKLLRSLVSVELIPGQLHLVVKKILVTLRQDGSIYERGGEVVRLTEKGLVVPLEAEYLTVYLTQIMSFFRPGKDKEGNDVLKAVDCPLDLAKRVLAMRGEFDFPILDAVLTAPIQTVDGTILEEAGYDDATRTFMFQNNPDAAPVPRTPTVAQVTDALKFLWRPFENFPFVGNADKSVILAAILTAIMRPTLPTAPGFLLAAPTAGSGKTLLMICLSILAGTENPALMPPSDNEEEIRKRMLAALREAKPVLVLDNVVGHLDSAALCVLLTSREYSDRLLGSSVTLSVPTNTLVMASGNNVKLVGDLNRRFLTCTIDPKTDKAYRRTFDLNPAEFTRAHRQEMVVAALTILQGYRTLGSKMTQDRTASFEDWSDAVRQAVMWAGTLGVLDLPDPCDSIDASYDQDPETRKLQTLLESWHCAYQGSPRKIQQVIRDLPDPDDQVDDSPLSQLYDAADEIAGERGRVNPRRLGRWIERMNGRVCGGKKFEIAGRSGGSNLWRVCTN